MIKPPETITVDTSKIWCDGNGADLGHPRVYLTMKNGSVDCPYCGRHFVLASGTQRAAAH